MAERAFLNVERSVTGRRWVLRAGHAEMAEAAAMMQRHGLGDLLSRVLAGRGVRADEAERFLGPRLRDLLPDPDVLTSMPQAVNRLAAMIERGVPVAIFGDYDVDGAASAALLAEALKHYGCEVRVHIPDRITEGYGPNIEAIRALHAEGARGLVTVDCGTVSHAPLAVAAALGLDPLVIDHHQAPEALPDGAVVINPNRQDDLSGLNYLCAAGVVFLTLVALNREMVKRGRAALDLLAALDFVALATVADVVPLVGLNRAFVRQGLAVMHQRRRPGLNALCDVAGLTGPPQAWHLGYLLGPRINAGGRIGDAALGARLLLTSDSGEATRIAAELDTLNRERQVIEQAALVEAHARIEADLMADPDLGALVVADMNWHPGVVGLIAARIKERHGRPAFAFALNGDGGGVGSARSVAGIDIGRAVRAAVEEGLAVKGGGHAMAAGVTLAPSGLAGFTRFVADALRQDVATAAETTHLPIDGPLTAEAATAALVEDIDRAGPYGSGHPEPVVALPGHRLVDASVVGAGHVRGRLKAPGGATIGLIAFRAAETDLGRFLIEARGTTLHVAGTLSVDRWGGGTRVDLRVTDAAVPA